MSDTEPLAQARALLAQVPTEPLAAVAALAQARTAVDEALDEQMVTAALAGASHRAIAQAAGVAPNTIPARLARSSLAAYAEGNRVGSQAVVRARYDREQGRPVPAPTQTEPLRFRRRTPGGTT